MNNEKINDINPEENTPLTGGADSEALNGMHKVPEGFKGFVDISSNKKSEPVEDSTEAKAEEKAEAPENAEETEGQKGYYQAKIEDDIPENKAPLSHKKQPVRKKSSLRIFYRSVVAVFCAFLTIVAILIIVTPDKEFSESENRVLAGKPVLSLTTITNGSFMKNFETYLTDQFPLRDSVIALKTLVDRAIGVKQENGVYIGKDGFLFDTPTAYDKASVSEKTRAISEFTLKYPKMKKAVVISPNSSYIYSDKLPENLKFPSQAGQLESISRALVDPKLNFIDAASILRRAKKAENAPQLFYKTDHHWTTRGAYEIYKELITLWKLDTKKVSHYFYTVSETFEGTLGSKSGVHDTTDTIEICVPGKSLGTYVVNFESQQKKTATLFESEKLQQKNQYEVFLGGNFDKVIVSTTSLTNNNLLLIKDSYANCMIPMLTAHFSKIVVIDPRYLTDNMDDIIKENNFTHILFLYNLNTFLEDTSLVDALSY